MPDLLKIVECPRDAWQALPAQIPAERKVAYITKLIAAGYKHIDAVSFVSPAAIPQMADSEAVLQLLDAPDDVEIIGIVVNRRGAERAIATGRVRTLGFPHSISAEFLKRNQHQTRAQSLQVLREIAFLAKGAGLGLVVYVSMAFGNPYGEPWSTGQIIAACRDVASAGVQQISLADTVGLASPADICEGFAATKGLRNQIEFGVHLHAPQRHAPAKIRAAYEAGCRRFDAAIGGLGGCPFAQDSLVGNIPTEVLIQTLTGLGAPLPPLRLDADILAANAEIAREFGTAHNLL